MLILQSVYANSAIAVLIQMGLASSPDVVSGLISSKKRQNVLSQVKIAQAIVWRDLRRQ